MERVKDSNQKEREVHNFPQPTEKLTQHICAGSSLVNGDITDLDGQYTSHIKLADGIFLGGVPSTGEGKINTHNNPKMLLKWSKTNNMKF